jgi:hypothetical protein
MVLSSGTWVMGNEIFYPLGYILQGDHKTYCIEECMTREQKAVAELYWHQYLQ